MKARPNLRIRKIENPSFTVEVQEGEAWRSIAGAHFRTEYEALAYMQSAAILLETIGFDGEGG